MKKPLPKNAPRRSNPFSYLFIIAVIAAGLTVVFQSEFSSNGKKVEVIPLSQLLVKYENKELLKVEVKDQKITAEGRDGEHYESIKEPFSGIKDLGFDDTANNTIVEVVDTTGEKFWMNVLIGAAPFILLVLLLMFISRRVGGGMGSENGPFGFGKSRAKVYDKTKNSTKFPDIAGADEAKEEVEEVVDFLKNPKKYQKAGATIPKGILLIGAPGTGKTLIARAIAGEADVPFFSVSGSEFVEMFVGVGASRVRDLFKTAKRNAPAIIFIDEIDAIGKQRGGSGGSGGHDEREQTLNQILTEMDGFESDTSVIVIGATNRPDVLDKALLRPGRFDRRITVDLPDLKAREQILKVHIKTRKLAKAVDLKKIASKTVGFSGADLENIMNEATILSVKKGRHQIIQNDLEDSVEKVAMGPERKSRRITKKEREIIAHHEVGHALSGHFTENCEPVHKISIISRGGALGVTWFLPEKDTYLTSEQKFKDEMVSLHGGRVAEELIFGQTTTGASNDLERISKIARSMVMTYGMGDKKKLGPVVFSEKSKGFVGIDFHEKEYAQETAKLIDEEVKRLVLEAEDRCRAILEKHIDLLKQISGDLLKKESLGRSAFLNYFK